MFLQLLLLLLLMVLSLKLSFFALYAVMSGIGPGLFTEVHLTYYFDPIPILVPHFLVSNQHIKHSVKEKGE